MISDALVVVAALAMAKFRMIFVHLGASARLLEHVLCW